jgi:hypothetical protein
MRAATDPKVMRAATVPFFAWCVLAPGPGSHVEAPR